MFVILPVFHVLALPVSLPDLLLIPIIDETLNDVLGYKSGESGVFTLCTSKTLRLSFLLLPNKTDFRMFTVGSCYIFTLFVCCDFSPDTEGFWIKERKPSDCLTPVKH
ncbi:hypothetical protein XENOCAPTIV_014122 [Xenoophorus captivus]|uniref:Uncharacterized protein n=1 Tax=Xenoophorus captivus TaxID=1517983 RepID=A0ABV0QRT0_9TELE